MTRSEIAGLVAIAVIVYIDVVLGVRYFIPWDASGNWNAAIGAANGIAIVLLTAALVGVTAWYARLTGRLVELTESAPARESKQKAMQDLAVALYETDSALGTLQETVSQIVKQEPSAAGAERLDSAITPVLDKATRVYGLGMLVSGQARDAALLVHQRSIAASRQALLISGAYVNEQLNANEAKRKSDWAGVGRRYEKEISPSIQPDERQEWKEVVRMTKADAALTAVRRARAVVDHALHTPPTTGPKLA